MVLPAGRGDKGGFRAARGFRRDNGYAAWFCENALDLVVTVLAGSGPTASARRGYGRKGDLVKCAARRLLVAPSGAAKRGDWGGGRGEPAFAGRVVRPPFVPTTHASARHSALTRLPARKNRPSATPVLKAHSPRASRFSVAHDTGYRRLCPVTASRHPAWISTHVRARPVSLWLEDYSALRQLFVQWRARGVSDIRAHSWRFRHPAAAGRLQRRTEGAAVNQRTWRCLRRPIRPR